MSEGRQFVVETLDAQGNVVSTIGVSGLRVVASAVTGVSTGAASSIATYAGNGQTGTVGTAVTVPPAVRVTDANGLPVVGSTVTWLPGGGSGVTSTGNTSTTNYNGVATVGSWTMGTLASGSSYSLLAYSTNLTNSPLKFVVTSVASASPFSLAISGGTSQTTTPTGTHLSRMSVLVTDQYANILSNATITLTSTDAAGIFSSSTITTNTSGVAGFIYTAGVTASNNSIYANLLNSATSVTFTSITTSGPANSITIVSGDGQTGLSGATLANAIVVSVDDGFGNPVGSGSTLQYVTVLGSGNLSLATQTPIASAGSFTWKVGATAGQNAVEISLQNVSGSTVTAFASGTNPTADTILYESGGTQTGTVAATLALPFAVATTGSGSSASGQIVTWSITSSPGGNPSLSTDRTVSSTSGVARTVLSLGTVVGVIEVQASGGTLAGSPIYFYATATANSATSLILTTQPLVNTQAGVAWSQQPVVVSTDSWGNLVSTNTRVEAVLFNTPTPNGTLGSNTSTAVIASGATATFSGLSYNGSGVFQTCYRCNSLSTATANQQNGAPPFASQLGFTLQPTNTVQGQSIAPGPVVAVQDSTGATVTTATNQVTVAISGAGALNGTLAQNAVAGLATFSGIGPTAGTPAGGYTLVATATGLTGATSASFNVTAAGGGGGATYANQPSGHSTLHEYQHDKTNAQLGTNTMHVVSGVTGQIYVSGNYHNLHSEFGIDDATAPYGVTQVGRTRFTNGSLYNGTAADNLGMWSRPTLQGYMNNQLYICHIFKVVGDGTAYEQNAGGTKWGFWHSGSATDSAINLLWLNNLTGVQQRQTQWQMLFKQQGGANNVMGQINRSQNNGFSGNYRIQLNTWHRIEVVAGMSTLGAEVLQANGTYLADGTFDLYVSDWNGTGWSTPDHIMTYNNVCYRRTGTNTSKGFGFAYWNPTYGGGSTITLSQNNDIYHARWFVSGK